MLQRAERFSGHAVALRNEGAGHHWRGELGRVEEVPGRGETWQSVGALAGAAVERARMRMQDNKALVAFLAGMAIGDAYRELLRVAAVDKPGLRATAQEIENEALDRVASFAALPLEGAGQIDGVMEQVRALASVHWKGSARIAPRAETLAPGGQPVASRRRGRPSGGE